MNHQEIIANALPHALEEIAPIADHQISRGKVRDSFLLNKQERVIVVSDRISAFDSVLGTIPFKGQVLNQIALWWFERAGEIGISHHILGSPDVNISVVRNATPIPIEVVVRGYLTGSTKTSSWYAYQNLDRVICGITMPAGMRKNQVFPQAIITPTTKPDSGHDEAITRDEIFNRNLISRQKYEEIEEIAYTLFASGQKIARERGLILVDTKYEMGIDDKGNIMLIDEVHTPDSSRFWLEEGYEDAFEHAIEPDNLDKEFVRRMIVEQGYDVDQSDDPKQYLTTSLRTRAAARYIELFQRVTGSQFVFPENLEISNRVNRCITGLVEGSQK